MFPSKSEYSDCRSNEVDKGPDEAQIEDIDAGVCANFGH
jgi:hypothetical protein